MITRIPMITLCSVTTYWQWYGFMTLLPGVIIVRAPVKEMVLPCADTRRMQVAKQKESCDMQTIGITFEPEANRMKFTEALSWTDMASDCTGHRMNIDAALDYSQDSIIRENI